jgi:AcrR family transcriptional regulator
VKNIDLRVKKGRITYDQLAEQMKLNRNTIYNWFKKSDLDEVKRQRLEKAIEQIERSENNA